MAVSRGADFGQGSKVEMIDNFVLNKVNVAAPVSRK